MEWYFVGGEGEERGGERGCVVDVEVFVVRKGRGGGVKKGDKVVRAVKKEAGEINWGEWLRKGEAWVERGVGVGEMIRMGTVLYGGGWKDM